MPYIIATRRSAKQLQPGQSTYEETAVATLDEAAAVVVGARNRANERQPGATTSISLTESGGTVGPLPDGTVIEVRHLRWSALAHEADESTEARHVEGDWPASHLASRRRNVLRAFNARA